MKNIRVWWLIGGIGLAGSAMEPVAADEVVLKSGLTKVGIIEQETDELIRLRTALGATGISREFVAEVRRATPAENAALEAEWAAQAKAEAAERATRREAREAFADAQREKGLILFEGDWVTPEEAGLRREERRASANLAQLKSSLQVAEQRAAAAELRAATTEAEVTGLRDGLRERDATLDELGGRLREAEYALAHCGEAYQAAIHSLRRRLDACEAQLTPQSTP